ncbi:MAG: CYTH domain-containing protein [Caulobacterales bacterium]
MPKEIERKFLVSGDGWKSLVEKRISIRQGYIARGGDCSVRIRETGETAFLTIKSGARGLERDEYEYEIPSQHAEQMLRDFSGGAVLEKTRHVAPWKGCTWEVDEFHGGHAGLILAECELQSADQAITLPEWIGREVTDDPAFGNEQLARALLKNS